MADNAQILDQAEKDIDAFDQWFQDQGAQALVRSERAIIKTFLVALRSGKLHPAPTTQGEELGPCRLT